MAGAGSGVVPQSLIDSFTFHSETIATPSATLSVARYGATGVNSSSKGYFAGGPTSFLIDGIRFADEAAASVSALLSFPRAYSAGVESSSIGYWAGGFRSGYSVQSHIDGIQFSNETAVDPASGLSVGRREMGTASSPSAVFVDPTLAPTDSPFGGYVYSTSAGGLATATDSLSAEVIVVQIGNQTFLIFFN